MRTPPAPQQVVPATLPRMPSTRKNRLGFSRSAYSKRGGPPHRVPLRPKRQSRDVPLRSLPGEATDPLARLAPAELGDRLANHLLELRQPILDGVRDQGLQIVELLAGRWQLVLVILPRHSRVRRLGL